MASFNKLVKKLVFFFIVLCELKTPEQLCIEEREMIGKINTPLGKSIICCLSFARASDLRHFCVMKRFSNLWKCLKTASAKILVQRKRACFLS